MHVEIPHITTITRVQHIIPLRTKDITCLGPKHEQIDAIIIYPNCNHNHISLLRSTTYMYKEFNEA